MKKRIILTVLAGMFSVLAYSQTPANDPHWQFVWGDEFDFFNSNIWHKGTDPHSQNDTVTSRPENVFVSNGNLVLRLLKEDYIHNGRLYHYTNGVVINYNPGMQFGYIEASMKLPHGRGLWPSFWTWKLHPNASNEAEIDIFEMKGERPSNSITTNLHTCFPDRDLYPKPQIDPNCIEDYYLKIDLSNFSYTSWNTYAIEWTPTKFIWYVNGIVVRNSLNPGIIDPVRIIMGTGLDKEVKNLTTSFPADMLVDYVRVYRLKCDKSTVVTQIPNFNTYNYAVKKSISLSSTTTIPQNSHISLRATDFIELKDGFVVPLGAELYLDTSPCEMSKTIKQLSPNE